MSQVLSDNQNSKTNKAQMQFTLQPEMPTLHSDLGGYLHI